MHRSESLAMLTCGSKFGKNVHFSVSREILVEVEHVKGAPHKEGKEKDVAFSEVLSLRGNEKSG